MKKFLPVLAISLILCPCTYSQDWIPQAHDLLPEGYAVFSISVVSDQVVWLAASEKAVIEIYQPVPSDHVTLLLRTTDGGSNWEMIEVDEAMGTFSWEILALNADTAWITTQCYGSVAGNGLYKTMTGAATAFQSGFSSLGENKEFINYVSGIFKPYQTRIDKAVSSFMGVEVGAYKSMPMSQVMEAMEKNFSEMSMDEIGSRFENLIDDMGGI